MMRNVYLVILAIFTMTANNNFSRNVIQKKPLEASFTSAITSMTKINLDLHENNTFTLIIDIFGSEIPPTKSKGTWYKKDNYYILTFKKRNSPSLKALFPQSAEKENVEIIDTESFKFKENAVELIIYGIPCNRGNVILG